MYYMLLSDISNLKVDLIIARRTFMNIQLT